MSQGSPLHATLVLQPKLNVAVFEAAVCVPERLDPEFPGSLKSFHASSVDDHRLRTIRRAPVDLGFGVGIQNRKDHRVPFAVIDDGLRRGSATLGPRAQRLERVDLTEIDDLGGRFVSIAKRARAKRRHRHNTHNWLKLHGPHISRDPAAPNNSSPGIFVPKVRLNAALPLPHCTTKPEV